MPLVPFNMLTQVSHPSCRWIVHVFSHHIPYFEFTNNINFLCNFIVNVKFEIDWYVKIKVTVSNLWTRFKINFSLWKYYIIIDKLLWGNCWILLSEIILFRHYKFNSNLLMSWSLKIFFYCVKFCPCKSSIFFYNC